MRVGKISNGSCDGVANGRFPEDEKVQQVLRRVFLVHIQVSEASLNSPPPALTSCESLVQCVCLGVLLLENI